jgi:hypothetical protein
LPRERNFTRLSLCPLFASKIKGSLLLALDIADPNCGLCDRALGLEMNIPAAIATKIAVRDMEAVVRFIFPPSITKAESENKTLKLKNNFFAGSTSVKARSLGAIICRTHARLRPESVQ